MVELLRKTFFSMKFNFFNIIKEGNLNICISISDGHKTEGQLIHDDLNEALDSKGTLLII